MWLGAWQCICKHVHLRFWWMSHLFSFARQESSLTRLLQFTSFSISFADTYQISSVYLTDLRVLGDWPMKYHLTSRQTTIYVLFCFVLFFHILSLALFMHNFLNNILSPSPRYFSNTCRTVRLTDGLPCYLYVLVHFNFQQLRTSGLINYTFSR